MAYQTRWYDDEETVLIYEVMGETSWDDFHTMNHDLIEHIQAAPGRLDVITLMNGKRAQSSNPLPHLQTYARRMKAVKSKGMILMVNQHLSAAFFQSLMNVVATTVKMIDPAYQGQVCRSLDEALTRIKQDRLRQGIALPTARV